MVKSKIWFEIGPQCGIIVVISCLKEKSQHFSKQMSASIACTLAGFSMSAIVGLDGDIRQLVVPLFVDEGSAKRWEVGVVQIVLDEIHSNKVQVFFIKEVNRDEAGVSGVREKDVGVGAFP